MSIDLLTVPEVAARLRVNHDTVRRLAHEGKLRGSKPVRRWLFTPSDVDAFVAQAANVEPAPAVRRRRRRAA